MSMTDTDFCDGVACKIADRLKDDRDVDARVIAADMNVDDGDPYLFSATITKSVLDRDGEVILPGGMDASEFDKSGAVYWNHDYDKPIAIPTGVSKTGDSVTAKARFMERPEGYEGEWFPDFARQFVTEMSKAGRSAGVSIGFIPTERRRPSKKDVEDYGDDTTVVTTRWKLLEWSVAPMQANPDAYVTAIGKSLASKLFSVAADPAPEPSEKAKRKVSLWVMRSLPAPKPKRKVDVEIVARRVVAKMTGKLYA